MAAIAAMTVMDWTQKSGVLPSACRIEQIAVVLGADVLDQAARLSRADSGEAPARAVERVRILILATTSSFCPFSINRQRS
jgi:hypothetical protein